jgi:hypothetical protein
MLYILYNHFKYKNLDYIYYINYKKHSYFRNYTIKEIKKAEIIIDSKNSILEKAYRSPEYKD